MYTLLAEYKSQSPQCEAECSFPLGKPPSMALNMDRFACRPSFLNHDFLLSPVSGMNVCSSTSSGSTSPDFPR